LEDLDKSDDKNEKIVKSQTIENRDKAEYNVEET
jgi:hypothetical protein